MSGSTIQRAISILVTIVLALVFSVPLAIIAYGVLGGVAGGLLILGVVIGIPLVLMFVGWLVFGSVCAVVDKFWRMLSRSTD